MSAPIACTLPGPQLRERLTTIAELAQRMLLSHEQEGRVLRLRYVSSAAEELDRVVAQERECCAFLDFELVRRSDAVHLIITAPAGAEEFASVLTSHFLGKAQAQVEGCSPSCGCSSVA